LTVTVVNGDNCPSITSSFAAPAQTSVGGSVSVGATASDPDATDTLTYSWAPAANFTNPTAATTSYNCTTDGLQTLTLTVNDNHTPSNCTPKITMQVNCVKVAVCGNGVVEPGETCDPPNGTTCSALCQTIVVGAGGSTGAGGVVGAGGTTGAGGQGTGGVVGAGGQGTGGVVGAGGSTGTGGTSGGGATTGQSAACTSCELNGTNNGVCFNTSGTNLGTSAANFGCQGLTGTAQSSCFALLACLRGPACQTAIASASADYGESGVGNDDATPCLCGSIAKATCLTQSSWTGVCAPQFVTAAAGGSVLNLFFSTDSPIGVANNDFTCDIDNTCGSACGVGQ
jgi:hypothetical protein